MSVRETEITAASVWRSDHERHREIYTIAGDFSRRLRAQLIKAAREASLMGTTRDARPAVATQPGSEALGLS